MVEWQKRMKHKLSLPMKLQQIKKFLGKLFYKNQLQESLTSMSSLTWIKVFLAWLRWGVLFCFSRTGCIHKQHFLLQLHSVKAKTSCFVKLLYAVCKSKRNLQRFSFAVLGCYFSSVIPGTGSISKESVWGKLADYFSFLVITWRLKITILGGWSLKLLQICSEKFQSNPFKWMCCASFLEGSKPGDTWWMLSQI